MKAISSLVIALVAIFSVIASAEISPLNLTMVGNASQFSVAISEFNSLKNVDEGDNRGQVAFFFPGYFPTTSPAYKLLDCVTAVALDSSKFAIKRSIAYRSDEVSGYTRINHDLSFNSGDILGRFRTACSFITPETPRAGNADIYSSVLVGGRSTLISNRKSVIHPSNYFAREFSMYISPSYSHPKPTSFVIHDISKNATAKQFILRNPDAKDATTGATFTFATLGSSASCDVNWGTHMSPQAAKVTVIENGNAVRFDLTHPLNHNSETNHMIVFYCFNLRGEAHAEGFPKDAAKFFPSIIELSYVDNSQKLNKAYTRVMTPSQPSSDSFKTGFTTHSSFPHITPNSMFE